MRLVFDIEGNGLYDDVTTVHCIVTTDIDTNTTFTAADHYSYGKMTIDEMLEYMAEADELIGHNIIEYDLPTLFKLKGFKYKGKVTDTLVMSRLFNPDLPGGHSLGEWGKRLGKDKPGHEDWSKISHEMVYRCQEDVGINILLYNLLCAQYESDDKDWTEALETEHRVYEIITQQSINGVEFNTDYAELLLMDLKEIVSVIDSKILPTIPLLVSPNQPHLPAKMYKKDGSFSVYGQKYLDRFTPEESAKYPDATPILYHQIYLNSTKQVKQYLLDKGWTPTQWNYSKKTGEKTSPKITEDSIAPHLGDTPMLIKHRVQALHRYNNILGLVMRVRPDGRIPAGANSCGTNTFRMRHRGVVNIPKSGCDKEGNPLSFYGTEMRSLFTVPEGKFLVGHDASGLELRMLANAMNDPVYIDAILGGDIHSFNQEMAGLPTRDSAKTFIYAFLYGAGNAKIGSIIGGDERDGMEIKNKFMDSLPSLDNLLTGIKKESRQGYIVGLDGRKVRMRRQDGRVMEHKALNTRLQCDGALIMKKSIILLEDDIQRERLRSLKVIDMHDEGQYEVYQEEVRRHSQLAEQSIISSGEWFQLNIPLAADVKVGKTWADTH